MSRQLHGNYPDSSVQKKGKKFYVVFRWGTGVKWLPTPCTSKDEAKRTRQGRVKEWVDKARENTPLPPSNLEIQIGNFLEARYTPKLARPGTRRHVERALGRLVKLSPQQDLGAFLTTEFTEFSVILKKTHSLSEDAWKKHLDIYRSFFNWAYDQEPRLIGKVPIDEVKLKPEIKEKDPARVWTPEEFKIIQEKASVKNRAILLFLWETGIYLSDFYQLEPKHFYEMASGRMKMEKVRSKSKIGKTPLRYDQPLTKVAEKMVRDALKEGHSKVFAEYIGIGTEETFSSNFCHELKEYWEAAIPKIPNKTAIEIRHSYATRHIRNSVPYHILRRWMGHAAHSEVLLSTYEHEDDSSSYLNEKSF